MLGDWKAISPRAGAPFELYDLRSDPSESRNLAQDKPEIMARIRSILAEAHTPERDYVEETRPPGVNDYVK